MMWVPINRIADGRQPSTDVAGWPHRSAAMGLNMQSWAQGKVLCPPAVTGPLHCSVHALVPGLIAADVACTAAAPGTCASLHRPRPPLRWTSM